MPSWVDASPTGGTRVSSGSFVAHNHNVVQLTNDVALVIEVGIADSNSRNDAAASGTGGYISGVTVGTVPNQVAAQRWIRKNGQNNISDTQWASEIWIAKGLGGLGATGNHEVRVTASASMELFLASRLAESVDQSTPVGDAQIMPANGTSIALPSVTLTTQVGDLLIGLLMMNGTGGSFTWTSLTEFLNYTSTDQLISVTRAATGTSETLSASARSAGDVFSFVGVALRAPAGGGTPNNLEASGTVAVEGNANLTAEKLLGASGEVLLTGAAALQVDKRLAASGEVLVEGNANLSIIPSVNLAASGTVLVQGNALLQKEVRLVAAGSVSVGGAAELVAGAAEEAEIYRLDLPLRDLKDLYIGADLTVRKVNEVIERFNGLGNGRIAALEELLAGLSRDDTDFVFNNRIYAPDILVSRPRLDGRRFVEAGAGSQTLGLIAAIQAAYSTRSRLILPGADEPYWIGDMAWVQNITDHVVIEGDGQGMTELKLLDGATTLSGFGLLRLDPSVDGIVILLENITLNSNFTGNPLRLYLASGSAPSAYTIGETITNLDFPTRTATVRSIGSNYLGIEFPPLQGNTYEFDVGNTILGSTSGASSVVLSGHPTDFTKGLNPYSWESSANLRFGGNRLLSAQLHNVECLDQIGDAITPGGVKEMILDRVRVREADKSPRSGMTLATQFGRVMLNDCNWDQQLSVESAGTGITAPEEDFVVTASNCFFKSLNLSFARVTTKGTSEARFQGCSIGEIHSFGRWPVSFKQCIVRPTRQISVTGGIDEAVFDRCTFLVPAGFTQLTGTTVFAMYTFSTNGKNKVAFNRNRFLCDSTVALDYFIDAINCREQLKFVGNDFLAAHVPPLRFEQRGDQLDRLIIVGNHCFYAPASGAAVPQNFNFAQHWSRSDGQAREPITIEDNHVYGEFATLTNILPTWSGYIAGHYARMWLKRNKHRHASGQLYNLPTGAALTHIAPPHGAGVRMRLLSLDDVEVSAMPTAGSWVNGQRAFSLAPTLQGVSPNQYVVSAWLRLVTGTNHVLNTDWVEMRQLTGT